MQTPTMRTFPAEPVGGDAATLSVPAGGKAMNKEENDESSPDFLSKLPSLLKAIRQITALEVVVVSVFLLPYLAGAWFGVLDRLEIGLTGKYWGLGIAAAVYIIGVVLLLAKRKADQAKKEAERKAEETRKEVARTAAAAEEEEIHRREVARDRIIAYVDKARADSRKKGQPIEAVLYGTIRKNVDQSYTKEFLNSLVEHYPTILAKRRRKSDGALLIDKL